MRGWMNRASAACVLLVGLVFQHEIVAAAINPAARIDAYTEYHVVSEDGSLVSTYHVISRATNAETTDGLRKVSFPYSASAQRVEIIEAFTLKADGRRVKVPKSNLQEGLTPSKSISPEFKETTVVFPDLQIGDAVELKTRVATTPLFPGKFSQHKEFFRNFTSGRTSVTVDAPASMKLKFASWHMDFSETKVGKRQVLRWTLRDPRPDTSARRDYGVYEWGSEPAYAVSSFESTQEIARRYVEQATPRALVTPHLQALADKITQYAQSEREKVRLLHDWVSREIGYDGKCLDVGSLTPHDLARVIDNRLGDCKDHGALFQAMLQAKGIVSHQVLLDAHNLYQSPPVPVMAMTPNVITYVPSLDMFIDPTAAETPFGQLPWEMQDKPVFAAVEGVPARTAPDDGRSSQSLVTKLEMLADGSAKGTAELQAEGRVGQRIRLELKRLTKDQVTNAVKDQLGGFGIQGEGVMTTSDLRRRTDQFKSVNVFATKPFLRLDKAGAFGIAPMFYSPASVSHYLASLSVPVPDHPIGCTSSHSEELYEYTLPEGMQVLSIPEGVSVDGPLITYVSEYRLEGRILHARRSITDRMPANVCSAALMGEYKAALKPVQDDLRQQVLYK